MSNVVSFAPRKARAPISKPAPVATNGFQAEVDDDISKLCDSLGIEPEEAVKVAGDFYKRYPMLMEYVRSQEYLLRRE